MLIELQLETAKIQAQMSQLTGKFDDLGKTVEKQGGFLEKFKATAAGVFAGNVMASGLNVLKNAFVDAAKDAQEYEKLIAKTNAVIESTGAVAGISTKALLDQASALEKLSGVDENVILNGENVIATFTQIRNVAGAGNDVFNQTTAAALDLSVALGQDMQSSAIQLGKALNDPIKGVGALSRVGVTFDAQQKKMIKTMVESGDILGAQKVILAEVNREFGGAAKAAGDTFGGAVARAKDKVQDFMRDALLMLQPIILSIGKTIADFYSKYLAPLFSWLIKNKEAILLFAGIILTAVAAFKAYKIIMTATALAQEAFTIAVAVSKGVKLADIAVTDGMAGSMAILNAVMEANPIGLIVLAIAALAAGFVIAWNHSETFRKVIIDVAKAGVTAVGFLIEWVGKLATAFIKIETGSLRLLLKGLALLHVPGAAAALKGIEGAIDSVGNFFEDTANKVKGYTDSLDDLEKKKIKLPSFGPKLDEKGKSGNAKDPSGVTADQLKAAEAAAKEQAAAAKKAAEQRTKDIAAENKKVLDLYDEMRKTISEGEAKAAEALKKRDSEIAATKKKYADIEVKITQKKNDELKKNEDAWRADYKKANDAYSKAEIKIKETYDKRKKDIDESYAARVKELNAKSAQDLIDLENKTQKKITDLKEKAAEKRLDLEAQYAKKTNDLRSAAEEKSTDLIKNAADKRESIIKQSVDRLRSAFASKTGFDISESFKTTGSTEGLLTDLKNKLQGAKDLQANAAKLAGMGYSQVFIEEVVKNGPEAGNAIAEALKAASPEATTELQSLYNSVQDISAHGLDQLATTMNTGANLATEELRNAYSQVGVDLQNALATVATDLAKSLTELKTEHTQTMLDISTALAKDTEEVLADQQASIAEINSTLQKALDEAKAAQDKALADAAETRDAAIADAKETLDAALLAADEAFAAANKATLDDFNAALLENASAMTEALAALEQDYADTIANIATDTSNSLASLQEDVAAAILALLELGAVKDAAWAQQNSPANPYLVDGNVVTPYINDQGQNNLASVQVNNNYKIPQYFLSADASPDDVHKATLNAMKYGNAITIPPTSKGSVGAKLAGITD
jgi:hypothetical protein